MRRILVPVDGSVHAERAVRFVIDLASRLRPLDIHLLTVQEPLSGDMAIFFGKEKVRRFHEEEGQKTLRRARALLDKARLKYAAHVAVGAAAKAIVAHARAKRCDHIVMGSRGLGSVTGLVLGSVTTRVISHAPQPVTVVR